MSDNELDWGLDPAQEKNEDNTEPKDKLDELKSDFISACTKFITSPKRQAGLKRLLEWLDTKDFYTAPASTRYHGAYPGGLVEHSLDVLEFALKFAPFCEAELSEESIAVAALFHDLCKVSFYKLDKRRQKVGNEWKEVEYYTIDEAMNFGGHGSKSVYLISPFIVLKPDEAAAINCHMGFSDCAPGNGVASISRAYEQYPLSWLIHVADEAATYIRKRKKE